jgi:hypothetical protein
MARLVTPEELKAILGISDSVDNDRIATACDAATQAIQAACDRQFFLDTNATPRVYVRQSVLTVEVDDIGSTNGLVVATDEDEDGVFENVWPATDYQLEPLNGRYSGQVWPYTRIRAIEAREFPVDYGRALVQVTARWGWPTVPPAVKQAAQIQATTLFKAADAPLGIAGFGDIGVMRLRQALHPVAAQLIGPYRLDPVLVA